jgi:hypothetical protein
MEHASPAMHSVAPLQQAWPSPPHTPHSSMVTQKRMHEGSASTVEQIMPFEHREFAQHGWAAPPQALHSPSDELRRLTPRQTHSPPLQPSAQHGRVTPAVPLHGVASIAQIGVLVGVSVGVAVGVAVLAGVCVDVAVSIGVAVCVAVALLVAVLLGVGVLVAVAVAVAVLVEVCVRVAVDVTVGVLVGSAQTPNFSPGVFAHTPRQQLGETLQVSPSGLHALAETMRGTISRTARAAAATGSACRAVRSVCSVRKPVDLMRFRIMCPPVCSSARAE